MDQHLRNKKQKIFFSGIGGSGVSAIAGFMAQRGHSVAGSDRLFDRNPVHPLKEALQSRGITIVPQDGKGIDDTLGLAVFSTAVEADQPERLKAASLGIPVRTRPEFLAELSASFKTIAVAGTSGKSTTSSLLAFIMNESGLAPNFIGGGRVKQFITPGNPGNYLAGDSGFLIIEACESDGSIVHYRPEHTIILNLALDHHPVERTAGWFEALVSHTAGKVVLNADDKELRRLEMRNPVTFSIERDSDYGAGTVEFRQMSTVFSLRNREFIINTPGRHNLYNALACVSLLAEMGVPLDRISNALARFQGLERRFDVCMDNGKGLVIDDYAHNPHKISFLMETAKRLRERICYVFQPHGYGPTRLMKAEYIRAFSGGLRDSDHLILLPIFYSGGTAVPDISSSDLADGIRASGASVEVVGSRSEITGRLRDYRAYVVFGARDETLADLAKEIAGKLLE